MNRKQEMEESLRQFALHHHPAMIKIINEGMSLDMAQRIAREYGPCNAASLQIMAAGLSRVQDASLIRPLVENMYDEIGRENPEDSHILMFEKFMIAVNVDPKTCNPVPNSNVEKFISTFLEVRNEPTQHEALAFMHGFEAVFPFICSGIHSALMKSGIVSKEEAYFFEHHAEADIEHSARMLDIMEKTASCDEEWKKCISKSKASAELIYNLYLNIILNLPN